MKYRIEYRYYQYNSGKADNGNRIGNTYAENLAGAMNIALRINNAYEHHQRAMKSDTIIDRPGDIDDTVNDYIPYAGFFTETAKIFEVSEKEVTPTKNLPS